MQEEDKLKIEKLTKNDEGNGIHPSWLSNRYEDEGRGKGPRGLKGQGFVAGVRTEEEAEVVGEEVEGAR